METLRDEPGPDWARIGIINFLLRYGRLGFRDWGVRLASSAILAATRVTLKNDRIFGKNGAF
jgi:hypothetical protein